jgi:hypothetical protein
VLFASPARDGHINDMEVIQHENVFTLGYDITNNAVLNAHLGLVPHEPIYGEFHSTDTPTLLNHNKVAMINFDFSYPGEPGFKRVTPTIITRAGYEGQGFGTMLGLLSDHVIADVLERLADQFAGIRTYAVINDFVGMNGDTAFTGWSSRLAERLGYQRIADEYGRPTYKKKFF